MSDIRGTILEKAKEFAVEHHGAQMYGEHPYRKHLEDVVNTLIEFGYNQPYLLAAGYLHDTIEDTSADASDIRDEFGADVAKIVELVTNKTGEDKKDRTFEAISTDEDATKVKVADRISNLREGDYGTKKHYQKQDAVFRKHLSEVSPPDLWSEYERLIDLAERG